jgi:hypothetical protein
MLTAPVRRLQKLIDEAEAMAQQEQQLYEEQQEQQPQQMQTQQQQPPPQLAQPPPQQLQQQDGSQAAGGQLLGAGDPLAPLSADEQDQYPGMPEGYSDIYDRNLNDFSDAEIDQVMTHACQHCNKGCKGPSCRGQDVRCIA